MAVIRQAFTRVEIHGATGARWSSGARHERPDHSGATRRGAVEPREHGRGGRVHDQRADRDVPDHRSTGFLRAEAQLPPKRMADRIQSPQALSVGLPRQGDLRRGPRGDAPQGPRRSMRPTGDDGGPDAAGTGRAQDPYRCPPSPRGVGRYTSSLVLRSSKAVYISAWLDRRAGREEIVPKLLHARAPQNIEEERKIRKLAGSRHAPGDWIFRARIISLSWQGLRTAKIAEKLGCHPKTVRKRLHRFNAEGIDGLGDRPGAGRKPRITEDERSRIIALVSKDPPGKLLTEPGGGLQPEDETKAAYWTFVVMEKAAYEIGIEVGRSQVRRILLAEGVRWRRTRPWAESAGPEFVPKDRG